MGHPTREDPPLETKGGAPGGHRCELREGVGAPGAWEARRRIGEGSFALLRMTSVWLGKNAAGLGHNMLCPYAEEKCGQDWWVGGQGLPSELPKVGMLVTRGK